MIEIMRASGMNTQSATGPSGMKSVKKKCVKKCLKKVCNVNCFPGPGGKKNRQKERRLMKGFLSTAGTVSASTGGPSPSNLSIATSASVSGSRSQLNSGKRNVLTTIHFITARIVILFEFTVAGECRVDISTKKTPTLGLHRIAKLLGSENRINRSSAGSSG